MFSSLEAVPYLSQQFKLKKYLGLTEEEMKDNEHYWKQENKYNKDRNAAQSENIGLRNVGIQTPPSSDFDLEAPVEDIPEPGAEVDTPDVQTLGPEGTGAELGTGAGEI